MFVKKFLLATTAASSLLFAQAHMVYAAEDAVIVEAQTDGSAIVALPDGTKATLQEAIVNLIDNAVATGNPLIIQAAISQSVSSIVTNNGGASAIPSAAAVVQIRTLTAAVIAYARARLGSITGLSDNESAGLSGVILESAISALRTSMTAAPDVAAAIVEWTVAFAKLPAALAAAPAGGPLQTSRLDPNAITLDGVAEQAAAVNAAIRNAIIERPVVSPNRQPG
ncbi:hypothetical protein [Zavarzinia compransoris]|uniref:hypothetical protein n=1 Tax=Zavarzinia compransoris TaxID=1264899 RepID=UPI00105C01A8|nr:hypothetical protein [Zavarzinia compransoris]TDP45700.1 hypothetical protein DES42_105407 [Zavarzinia compransoris]